MNLKRTKAIPPRTDKENGHRVYNTNAGGPKSPGKWTAPTAPPERSIFGSKAYGDAPARRPKAGAPARPR